MHQYRDLCERNGIIMGDEMLASVCELAFDVAKEGSAPSAMKNYLYLAQRPLRAYSVAERALEEDAAFRARVAERATIENVGEGGYLWLHRPAGWEQRVADIGAGVEPTPPATIQWRDSSLDVPAVAPSLSERPPMPAPPVDDDATPSILENRPSTAPAPAQPTPSTQIPSPQPPASLIPPVSATPPMQRAQESSSQPVAPRTPADSDKAVVEPPIESPRSSEPTPEPKPEPEPMTLSQPAAAPTPEQPPRTSSTVSSIEDELSSLRGLVDRLADERQNVRSSVSELEVELETRRAENLEMFSKLTSLRDELSSAQTSETSVVADRDRAFGRIAELESDVARLTADVDRMAAEADGQSSEHGAALTDLAMVSSERDALQTELAATRDAQATSVADLTALRAESDGLAQAATERDSALSELQSLKAGNDLTTAQLESARADLTALTTERDALQGELDAVTTDRNAVTAQFNDTSTERDQLRGKLESVSTERGELRSQLATAEAEGRELTERIEAMDQLRADNTELASRLSVAEQARVDLEGQLEEVSEKWKGTTRQLSVFENVNGQLDAAVAERDALQGQLGQANESLAEIQGRIGTSHDQIRSELTSIESAFGESADAPPISNAVTAPPSADTVAAEIADADAAAEIAVDASEEAAPADDDTAAPKSVAPKSVAPKSATSISESSTLPPSATVSALVPTTPLRPTLKMQRATYSTAKASSSIRRFLAAAPWETCSAATKPNPPHRTTLLRSKPSRHRPTPLPTNRSLRPLADAGCPSPLGSTIPPLPRPWLRRPMSCSSLMATEPLASAGLTSMWPLAVALSSTTSAHSPQTLALLPT